MNSLVSYEWLKHYVTLKETPEDFAARMSLSGPAVEKIIPQGEALRNIVVGHVIDVKPHPNADKLRLAVTDIGSKKATIVCGGTNLKKDQWVAVAKIGAKVRWHGEGDLVELKPAEIRGVKSVGMICAANEIGLFDAFPHKEREILDLGDAVPGMTFRPGTPLADALGLSDDVVMDIEVTSNRVDAMGMVGLAREAAAILNRKFTWKPKPLPKIVGAHGVRPPTGSGRAPHAPTVAVRAKQVCPRYMAAKIEGVTVGPSPWWLKRRLMSAGLNSINNIVDITNYVLLEHAQPMHAFDAATVQNGIEVRLARRGERIQALDGKLYQLDDSMLIIADAAKPIAIAGIMGGERSGVASNTTSIILESATFDPVSIRRTARKLNLVSDSQARFEKGLSSQAPPFALARAIELVIDLAGGKLAGPITDAQTGTYKAKKFTITTDEANALMGVTLSQKDTVAILRRLGFGISTSGKKITATVPWWRDHDIEQARDLVEEIARVYGYANIPAVPPVGLAVRPMDSELLWEDRIREVAKGAGLIETYSYSFVSQELLAKANYDATKMLHVQNPLSADLEIMRTTLLPSLLQLASENREREGELRLFEVANVYYPKTTDDRSRAAGPRYAGLQTTDLPDEQLELGALFLGMREPWKAAKGFVEHVLHEMGIETVSWRRLASDTFWHPGRTVQAFVKGKLAATVGEVHPLIAERFKLDRRVALVDMPLEDAIPFATTAKRYKSLSPYPPAKRDLAVIVDHRVEYDDIAREIARSSSRAAGPRFAGPLIVSVDWFDTYVGKGLPDGKKSVAMHLEFSASDRTLETKDVDALMEKAVLALKEKFKAEVRA